MRCILNLKKPLHLTLKYYIYDKLDKEYGSVEEQPYKDV